jgi:hypothetical protein
MSWPTHFIPNQPRIEGEPPPRYYLTSLPYPIEVLETLAAGPAQYVSGGMNGVATKDEIEAAASFVSGLMVTYSYEEILAEDEIESAAAFVDGALVDRLVHADPGPDEIESAAQFVSGELRDGRVEYTNWPLAANQEALESGAAFVSGVMS